MLDSSLPQAVPRPLKRSASVASLPTPPRTHHKRKHASRNLEDDSSASEADSGSELKNKKQRTSARNSADEEEAFWLDDNAPPPPLDASSMNKQLPSGLVYRRRLAAAASTSSVGSAPVSPPPSNRKPTVAIAAPVTPEPPHRTKRGVPMRDSPNNPFLVSPASVVDDSASPTPSLSPHTPQHLERPTVTYVFRGVRGTFPNPLYDHERGRPRSPSARSRLPIEHPEYSPDPHCPPKLLFPAAPGKPLRSSARLRGRSSQKTLEEEIRVGRKRHVSISESEEEDEEPQGRRVRVKKLDVTTQLLQAGSSQEKEQ